MLENIIKNTLMSKNPKELRLKYQPAEIDLFNFSQDNLILEEVSIFPDKKLDKKPTKVIGQFLGLKKTSKVPKYILKQVKNLRNSLKYSRKFLMDTIE